MISLTAIIGGLLTLLFGAVGVYLAPWLKAKLGAERLAGVMDWVGAFVSAAEQIFPGDGRGKEKLGWVEAKLAARGFALDAEEIRALIEARVAELRMEMRTAEPVVVDVGAAEEDAEGEGRDASGLDDAAGTPPEETGSSEG